MKIDVALLRQQHLAIIDAGRQLERLLAGSFEDARPHLGTARSGLARLVARHQANEEQELQAPLRTHKLAGQIPSYDNIAAQTLELRLRYSAHIGRWPMAAIAADWSGCRASARILSRSLQVLALREERELFPLAQQLLNKI